MSQPSNPVRGSIPTIDGAHPPFRSTDISPSISRCCSKRCRIEGDGDEESPLPDTPLPKGIQVKLPETSVSKSNRPRGNICRKIEQDRNTDRLHIDHGYSVMSSEMQSLKGLQETTSRDSGQFYTDVRNHLMSVGKEQEEQTQMLHRHGEWFAGTYHRLTHLGRSVNQSRSDVPPRPAPPKIPPSETNGRRESPLGERAAQRNGQEANAPMNDGVYQAEYPNVPVASTVNDRNAFGAPRGYGIGSASGNRLRRLNPPPRLMRKCWEVG